MDSAYPPALLFGSFVEFLNLFLHQCDQRAHLHKLQTVWAQTKGIER
jgi:hypothetical protein